MKIALVHDWLTGMRGGEFVLEALCGIFPQADIYTLLHIPGAVSPAIEGHRITTSFIQRLPEVERRYRWYLPLMPAAIESFRLEGYDLVISSSHCVAKGVRPGGAPHLCYCHTPMRYAWDMYHHYFNRQRMGRAPLFAIERIMPLMRKWDLATTERVDSFVANSAYVAGRIKRIYRRDADVIHPPVDVEYYSHGPAQARGDHYLMVSAFAPYKRIDLALEAFGRMGKRLIVAGGGEDDKRLRSGAGPNITFLGPVSQEKLRELYKSAAAFIFPGEEDFGITPVEAMAAGAPVIAYGAGGALETVAGLDSDKPTGLFFKEQTVEGLVSAVEEFEKRRGDLRPENMVERAANFSREIFRERMAAHVAKFVAHGL
ncbi:MAG: glycosyltransferase [Nitrospinota bacterium]|nr:glycosyltransferase [Nitrospinota bacterium]